MSGQGQNETTWRRIQRVAVRENEISGEGNEGGKRNHERIIEGFYEGHIGLDINGGYVYSKKDGFVFDGKKYDSGDILLSGIAYTALDNYMRGEAGQKTARNILFRQEKKNE